MNHDKLDNNNTIYMINTQLGKLHLNIKSHPMSLFSKRLSFALGDIQFENISTRAGAAAFGCSVGMETLAAAYHSTVG